MPIRIVRNDITRMNVDAIVNAANTSLLGGGGVDGAIHRAAGPQLLEECRTLGGCRVGEAKITGGYALHCRYIIHTVGPVWRGGLLGERRQLAACYASALRLAHEHGCESIAFPLISAGTYGFPRDKALRTAMDAITSFLAEHEMMVYIVVFDRDSFRVSGKLFADVAQYIDDHYVDEGAVLREQMRRSQVCAMAPAPEYRDECAMTAPSASLEEELGCLEESFQQMVLRRIDEKGMKDADCYKRANMDRKHFSKLRKDVHYNPKKTTAVALAIALELTLEETRDLLARAGYALSHSSRFDIIIEYCIKNGIYDINTVNETLFDFDQSPLGV